MLKEFHTTKFETPEARHAASTLSRQRRKTMIDNLLVTYPVFDKLTSFITEHHRPLPDTDHSTKIVGGLLGKTRAGKTDIVKRYCNDWQPYQTDNGQVFPVIYIEATYQMTPYGLAEAVYKVTGAGSAPKIKASPLMTRSVERIIRARTELVFIDDAQFLLDNRSKAYAGLFFSFLKQLADTEALNIILVGEPSIDALVRSYPALEARGGFPNEPLQPFGEDEFDQFRLLLREVDLRLPFRELSNLASKRIAQDLYDFTGGAVGQVMNIVRPAAVQALADESPRILLQHLYRQAALRQKPGDPREYFGGAD